MNTATVARKAFDIIGGIHKDLDHVAEVLSCNAGGSLCMPGCGHCCQQSILVTDIAAQYIVGNIKTLPTGRRSVITDRLERWLKFEVPGVRLKFGNGNGDEAKIRSREYDLVSRVYCSFLDDNQICLVYPWRDILCRAWGVTRPATAAICPRPLLDGEKDTSRTFATTDAVEVQGILMQLSMLRGLLQDHLPEALYQGWLPYLVFRALAPERWAQIQGQVQEEKKTKYTGEVHWLVTREEVDLLCGPEPDFLAHTVKY